MITKVVPMSCNDYVLLSSYLQQDASGAGQTSTVNLGRCILLGVNDIIQKQKLRKIRKREESITFLVLLIECGIATNIAEIVY